MAQKTWYFDTTGDLKYDTQILAYMDRGDTGEIVEWHTGDAGAIGHQNISDRSEAGVNAQIESVARSLAFTHPNWKLGSAAAGAGMGVAWDEKHGSGGVPLGEEGEEYGLDPLKKSDFFEADGVTPKKREDIYDLVLKHKPDVAPHKIYQQIEDFMPKLQGVSEEDMGFAREGFKKDVWGISGAAGKASTEIQKAYGSGMGSSMRGAYGAQKDVAQKFEQAEQGLEQDIYGLKKDKEAEFETNIATWLEGIPEFKQGGRVPEKRQTFLDVLSKLPDAGGN